MKYLNFFIVLLIFTSCSLNSGQKLVDANFSIEGNLSEINCKSLIESELLKLEGIDYADLSLNKKVVRVKFNNQLISKRFIKNSIELINGGSSYKVSKIVVSNKIVSDKLAVNKSSKKRKQNLEEDELPTRISFPSIFRLFLAR